MVLLFASTLQLKYWLFKSPSLFHPGCERRGSWGRRALHAGDDGTVQPATERAAASQSHSDCLTSILWQGGADRRPSTVWHRPLQKFHRGEWGFVASPGCQTSHGHLTVHMFVFPKRATHFSTGIFKRALPLLEYFPTLNRRVHIDCGTVHPIIPKHAHSQW